MTRRSLEARRLIQTGDYGPPRLITGLNFTDFVYRPRRPEELDTAKGGGVVFSQARTRSMSRLPGGGLVETKVRDDGRSRPRQTDRRRILGADEIRQRRRR